jgi:methylated-DNA-[protein]-cysteine S-methyltransferase
MSGTTRRGKIGADLARDLSRLQVRAPRALRAEVLRSLGLGDRYVRVDGPAGSLFVAFNDKGISFVLGSAFFDDDASTFEDEFERRHGRPTTATDRPPKGLMEALRSGRGTGLNYDLRRLSEFERAVLRKALEIPRGEVRSYAWVAREIGRPKAMRAVGNALGNNPVPILIPCHRVVRSDGAIGNYALGPSMKVELLATEGVDTDELVRMERARVRFVGSDTTKVFCNPTCRNARRITDAHRVAFSSEKAARAAGYRPCRHCRPAA